jgi:hypothetical protein
MKLRACDVAVVPKRRSEIGSDSPTKVQSKRSAGEPHPSRSYSAADLSLREDFLFPHRDPVPKQSAIFSYA